MGPTPSGVPLAKMPHMTTKHDDLDDSIPRCPLCNARVYRTHRCTRRAQEMIPMPHDFRSRAAEARTLAHLTPEPEPEQLDLLDVEQRGVWPADWPRYSDG